MKLPGDAFTIEAVAKVGSVWQPYRNADVLGRAIVQYDRSSKCELLFHCVSYCRNFVLLESIFERQRQ